MHGLVLVTTDRAVLEEVLRSQEGRAAGRRRGSTPTRSSSTRPSAATSSRCCSSSAGRPRTSPGYVDGEAHPIDAGRRTAGSCGAYQREAVDGFWHGGSGVVVLPCGAGKTLVGAAAMAEAKATTLILVTNTVAARQWRHELLKRTSLTEDEIGEYSGCPQGDPAGHHRDVPGDDDPAEGRLHAPRAVRRPRLGPGRLRRGAPAAGADLPDDRRPAGPPPARPDRDAGARGRPRGRRLLAHRAEALRRAVEGHRGAGLHRAGRLRRGAGDADRLRAAGLRDRRAGGALPLRLDHRRPRPASSSSSSSGTAATRCW